MSRAILRSPLGSGDPEARNGYAEEFLFHSRVMTRETLHGQKFFSVSGADIDAAIRPGGIAAVARNVPTEAGEDRGQPHHIGVRVGRDGLARRIQLLRAIVIQLVEADGEELHHLARVVLIGIGGGIALVVAQHREELAHHRIQGHVLKQLPEVPECVRTEQIVVVGLAARHVLHREVADPEMTNISDSAYFTRWRS